MADTSFAAVAAGARASVCLRASEPSDRPFLLALYGTTREKELALVPWSAEQKEAFLRMQFEAQDRHYRQEFAAARFDIVERRGSPGKPIGRLYVDRRQDAIHVLDITLVPLERGRGIGTSLLTEILDQARSSGRIVSLYVEAENPAMRLYQRLGFRQVGDEGFYRFMVCRPGAPDGLGEES